ncbi:MAG: glycosyl hydrolase 53 family protein [Anaerolineae bacterium]|nr:glycosyl hydrolase 53 family protein [Anaerolineae bacterium]
MYLGGDLSYVNEVEDNGGVFYHRGNVGDPFRILRDYGANIARVRLWHTPLWTKYSDLKDVQRTIQRAKALGMAVMLDIHYSDTWADPAKQIIPAAWSEINDLRTLEIAVHDYTVDVLQTLDRQGLLPEFVQIGNEINTEMLMPGPYIEGATINWDRNARLINAGLRGARQAAPKSRLLIHIAQPENLIPWFDAASSAGVHDYDVIGLSYYPKWSIRSLEEAGQTIAQVRQRYHKEVMVVETAYPWTQEIGSTESHLLAEDAVLPAYPATPSGQREFLIALTETTQRNGGNGVIYWEPAWVSTPSQPSIWENAALFDYRHEVQEGIEFLRLSDTARAQE